MKDRHDKSYDAKALDSVEVFYEMLQGKSLPDGMIIPRGHLPKLSPKKAMSVIWFLQEHMGLLPDHYECCHICKSLFDTHKEGEYSERKGHHYCGNCIP